MGNPISLLSIIDTTSLQGVDPGHTHWRFGFGLFGNLNDCAGFRLDYDIRHPFRLPWSQFDHSGGINILNGGIGGWNFSIGRETPVSKAGDL